MKIKKKNKVIVSIVLYKNKYKKIKKLLNILLKENCVNKIILINNGNSDWAKNLSNKLIKYIKPIKNNGFGSGHNLSIKKYINFTNFFLICNPDITFCKGELDKLYEFAKKKKYKFVVPKICFPNGKIQNNCKLIPNPLNLFIRRFLPFLSNIFNKKYELKKANFNINLSVPIVSGCFMLIKSSILKKINGFDERFFMYLEDVDLCRRVLYYSDINYFSNSTIIHEFNRYSYKKFKYFIYHLLSTIKYFKKWKWFFDKDRNKYNKKFLKKIFINKK